MSSRQSSFDGTSGIASADGLNRRLSTSRASAGIRKRLSILAFWSAIAMPALYLPLLIDGIETVDRLGLFLGRFGLHVLALIGGRRRLVEP